MNQHNDLGGGDTTTLIIAVAVLVVALVQLGRMITVGGLFSDGLFVDGDVYMWLNRVEALAEGREWFDRVQPRVFPPEGHEQHWTRPLDILLLVGGWALSPVFGFRDGLALWANMFAPVVMIAAGWGLYRTARFLMEPRQAAFAVAAFAVHPMILLTFAWGRADHHALLRLGQVLFLLAFISFFVGQRHRLRRAFVAGWIGAWAVWVNIEALGFVLFGLVVLGLWWLVGNRDLVRCNVAFGAGLFAGAVVAVLVERGPAFFAPYPVDTIGFAYVVLFGLTFAFWGGVALWTKYGPDSNLAVRAAVAGVLAAAVLGVLAVVEPSFFAGPFGEVDELYRRVRLEVLGEQLPALRFGEQTAVALVGRALSLYGMFLVGLWGLWMGYRKAGSAREKWMWAMLAVMATGFAVLSLDTVRWSAYLPAAAAPGYALVAGWCLDRLGDGLDRRWTSVARPVAVLVLVVGFPALGALLQQVAPQPVPTEAEAPGDKAATGSCDLRPAANQLARADGIEGDELVAIDPDRSAELMYRTGFSVVAIANHRYQPGFTLYHQAMTAREMEEAAGKLQQGGVQLVMVCGSQIWPTLRDEGQTVVERLGAGEYGGGFRPVVEADEGGGWWIYEVER